MNEKSRCLIWDTPAIDKSKGGHDVGLVDSPRAGGRYFIIRSAIRCLPRANARVKVRLTTWLVDQRRLGNECPEIDSNTITMAEEKRDLSVHNRADRLLQYIGDQTVEIGTPFVFTSEEMITTAIAAWSESVSENEVLYLLAYLDKQSWIEKKIRLHIEIDSF